MNPLHSSATPDKGADLAMGLEITGIEEEGIPVPEVLVVMNEQELVGGCPRVPGTDRITPAVTSV